MSSLKNAPDLTARPPRSARVRLGGYVILPRMLDKGRATLAGKNGDFHYNCPMDQHFVNFVGIDAKALLKELKKGTGDGEILAWVEKTAKKKRGPEEIRNWSAYHEQRGPTDVETREYFSKLHKGCAPQREDIGGWFDLLDVDDFVSYGGKA